MDALPGRADAVLPGWAAVNQLRRPKTDPGTPDLANLRRHNVELAEAIGTAMDVCDAANTSLPMRLIGDTTGAASTRLTKDATTATARNTPCLLAQDALSRTAYYRIRAIARWTSGAGGTMGDYAVWDFEMGLSIPTNAASTVAAGGGATVSPTRSKGAGASWTLGATADTTLGGLNVTGNGAATHNVTWWADVWAM